MKRLVTFGVIIIVIAVVLGFLYCFFFENKSSDSEITLYGNVDIRESNLGFRVFGKLDKMLYEEGDHVKTGDLLAMLDKVPLKEQVESARADVEQKKAAYLNSILIARRKKELLKQKFATREDYDNAESSKLQALAALDVSKANLAIAITNLEDADLKSPSPGTLITRVREPGTILNPGDTVYVLALDNPVWVRTYINETQLGLIYPGMKASIYTDSRKEPYIGQIGFISPVAEFTPKTVETTELRTKLVYRIRIPIANKDRYLRQGMPVTIKINLAKKK